jgi:hypothetical protein
MNKLLRGIVPVSALMVIIIAAGISYGDDVKPFNISVTISPKTIVLGSGGQWITAHTNIALGDVDCSSLTLNGVPVAWTKADAQGNLVAKFHKAEIDAIVSPPAAVLVLSGLTNNGVGFSGADDVVVIEQEQR